MKILHIEILLQTILKIHKIMKMFLGKCLKLMITTIKINNSNNKKCICYSIHNRNKNI